MGKFSLITPSVGVINVYFDQIHLTFNFKSKVSHDVFENKK